MQSPPTAIANLRINSDRLRRDFEELAEIGATPTGGINRQALSISDLEARAWLANRIEETGLLVRDDDAGNLSAVLPCAEVRAKTLLLGSHLDSVPDGGRFDGAIGVLGALECLRTVKEAGLALSVHLEAINFTDDEGAWQSLMGSMALSGKLTPAFVAGHSDNGAFRAALARAGISANDLHKARRTRKSVLAFLELHIEQGERLEKMQRDIGVVTGIVGRTTYRMVFYGEAGHSGTTSMEDRRDALQGAALFVTRSHQFVHEDYPEGLTNCGNLEVVHGMFNVIPHEVRLTVECRHADEAVLTEIERRLVEIAHECAAACGLTVETERIVHMPAAPMAEEVMAAIERACDSLALSHTRLVSYAGHDAQMMSHFTPSGMIFIPSVKGISHSPEEYSHWEDVVNGTNVLLHAALGLI